MEKHKKEANKIKKYEDIFKKYGNKYGVPLDFIKVVCVIESSFVPTAQNEGYKGLFALSEAEFSKYYDVKDIFDPEKNSDVGIQLLKQRLATAGTYMTAVGLTP